MAEQEVVGVAAPDDAPDWFKKWAVNANYKFVKLFRSIANSLTVKDGLSSSIIRASVRNNDITTLTHNLNREHDFIAIGNGRVLNYDIVSIGTNFVKIKVRLPSTSTVHTTTALENKLDVLDASIFKIGDVVQINGDARTIINIVDNRITLSDRVNLRYLRSVTLARETVSFLIL